MRCPHGFAWPDRDCPRCIRDIAAKAHAEAAARRCESGRTYFTNFGIRCVLCGTAGHVAKLCPETAVGRARA